MALTLYRRHRVSCPHRSTLYRRCQCPIYVQGTIGSPAQHIRESLNQTDWGAAQLVLSKWVQDGRISDLTPQAGKPIAEAVKAFLEDGEARGLAVPTVRKYRVLLNRKLLPWCERHAYTTLPELTLDVLTQFRLTWTQGALSRLKDQERLRAFLKWCSARGWVSTNEAVHLSRIRTTAAPTLPFTSEEMDRILAAIDQYPQHAGGYGHDNRARVRAFVLTARWTGLRMSDLVGLEWSSVKDGTIFLYTHKTGTHVSVPVPPDCAAALAALPQEKARVFWNGFGQLEYACGVWRRTLKRLFEIAEVPNGHAHRFRDTFAVELLLQGADLQDVSVLLGHSSVKITEKHYSPWVKTRQTRLESVVRGTWAPIVEPPAPPPVQTPVVEPVRPPTRESSLPYRASLRLVRGGNVDG